MKDYEVRPTSFDLLKLPLLKKVPENTRPVSTHEIHLYQTLIYLLLFH